MTSEAVLIDAIDQAFGGNSTIERIGVAVSGGSDSMALLHALVAWGQKPVVAATVDHGLRPEAADEARTVSDRCDTLGVPHMTLEWRGWDGKGNLQAEARRNRYALLAAWAREADLDVVCLGHTLDDQVETFLMRLSRAAGLEGLAGMPARFHRDGLRFERPFLMARREELRAYLTAKGESWIDDPSNDDDSYERVRARRAIAELETLGFDMESFDHAIVNLNLANLAVNDHLREKASRIVKEVAGDIIVDRAGLRRLNPELQRRFLARALMHVSSETYPPRADSLSSAESAIFAGKNHTLHGCLLMVSDMTVRITREFKAVERLVGSIEKPWDQRWVIEGPADTGLEIRALGEAVNDTDWRETGLPRQSLLATPAIWRGDVLVAAPVAGLSNGWTAEATGRGKFTDFLISR